MTKPTKWLYAHRRLRSAWASAQSGCPGWSESSLGSQSLWWFCHEVAHIYSDLCFSSANNAWYRIRILTDIGLASDLGLHCLPLSPKRDARLIWVNKILLLVHCRILGADTFEGLGGVQVHACFVKESLINSCYDCDAEILNTDGLEEKGWKTEKPGKATKFVYQRSSAVYEATLNVEVHVNLKRSKDVPVFKEKYRLVFYTQLKNEKYWVSLSTVKNIFTPPR